MKPLFLVCMGGNGSMIAESIVHMAAFGAMRAPEIHILFIEVDRGNGNLSRTRKLLKEYIALHTQCNKQTSFFRPKLLPYYWAPFAATIRDEDATLRRTTQLDPSDQKLARHLYTTDELAHPITVGFKGHPNLGVVFMENLLSARDEHPQIERFLTALTNSQQKHVLFVGSCYGGTGAASLPVMGQYFRRKLRFGDDYHFSALVMLPTFNVNLSQTPDEKLSINSGEFENKVRTVLEAYKLENLWPSENTGEPLYERLFLLGAPERITYYQYAPGKDAQINPANYYTWFACTAVEQFYSDAQVLSPGVYIAGAGDGPWGWNRFSSSVFPKLQGRVGLLLRAAVTYLYCLYPEMRNQHPFSPDDLLYAYYSAEGDNFPGWQEDLKRSSNAFTLYSIYLVNWLFQITTHLPPAAHTQESFEANLENHEAFHGCSIASIKNRFIATNPSEEAMFQSLCTQRWIKAQVLSYLAKKQLPESDKVKDPIQPFKIKSIWNSFLGEEYPDPILQCANTITGMPPVRSVQVHSDMGYVNGLLPPALHAKPDAVWKAMLQALLQANTLDTRED